MITSITQNTRYFFILNARSGNDDTPDIKERIEERFRHAGRLFSTTLVEDPGRLAELTERAVNEAIREHGVVVAVGGDGAINAVAHQVIDKNCPLGVIPQGTFNYFARSYGIPESLDESLDILLEGHIQPVRIGRVNDRLFLVNASIGLYPHLYETREKHKRDLGRSRLVAFVSGFFTVLGFDRLMRISLETSQKNLELRTPSLFVGNNRLQLEQIGIVAADEFEEERLVAIITRPAGRLEMLKMMFSTALGRLGDEPQIISFHFKTMTVKHAGGRRRRLKVAIDGEVIRLQTPLDFSISPQPLYIVTPNPGDES